MAMMRRHSIFLTFIFFAGLASNALAAELRVDVKNLRSSDGNVHFAIYSDPKTFLGKESMVKDIILPVKDKNVEAVFGGLEPGEYALAIFHDENGNREFDQGLFGIPLEGYGFSNGAGIFFGPPDFEDAAVKVNKGDSKISIPMVYFFD